MSKNELNENVYEKHKKSVAFVLTVSMFLTVLAGFMPEVIALENEKTSEEIFVLPDAAETLEEAECFVERLSELETDLNTLAFKNIDGTTTIKVFGHPVKYIYETLTCEPIMRDGNRMYRIWDGTITMNTTYSSNTIANCFG